jgi:hypothetical protein
MSSLSDGEHALVVSYGRGEEHSESRESTKKGGGNEERGALNECLFRDATFMIDDACWSSQTLLLFWNHTHHRQGEREKGREKDLACNRRPYSLVTQ